MADDKADSRALDLCAIGLGQGGGNLAAEWRRRGYRGLLLNTARADFKALGRHEGLEVPSKYTIDIALEGSDGAGKDPEYGRACVRAHADEIRAAVEKQLAGADALLVSAGLGGGTGSACAELVKILEDLEIPLVTVTTLPSTAESGIAKVNAVKAVNHLVTAPLSGRVFIDNDRLMEAFPELDLVSYYPAVNARVLSPLDELNRLNGRSDLWSIRSFDSEDLRKVLLSGGVLQTHVARLRDDGPMQAEDLVEVISACVGGGAHLAQGLSLEDIAYLALVVVGPEKALRSTAMHVFDEAIRSIKEKSGGGAVYEGLYVGGEEETLKAYVLSASLHLPARISSLLGEAQSEGKDLARKIQEELPELEISPLEGLELFRAPTRRARPARERPRSPEPRPLAEQLEGELPTLSRLRRKGDGARREQETSSEEPPAAGAPASPPRDVEPPAAEPPANAAEPPLKSVEPPANAAEPPLKSAEPPAKAAEPPAKAAEARRARVENPFAKKAPDAAPAPREGEPAPSPAALLEAPTVEVARAEVVEQSASARPRVGTGRYDEEEARQLERTALYIDVREARDAALAAAPSEPLPEAPSEAQPKAPAEALFEARPDALPETTIFLDEKGKRVQLAERPKTKSRAIALAPQVGTGRWDEEDDASLVAQEPTAMVERLEDALPQRSAAGRPAARPPTGRAPILPEDAAVDYDLDADAFEVALTGAGAGELHPAIGDDEDRSEKTRTDASLPSFLQSSAAGSALSSAIDPSGTELQAIYEDLIDRFRQSPDRRGRERIARRLIDDARADDVEIRALAVWAMVKLGDAGFRRALSKAADDENPEISKLASSGLERLSG